MVTNFNALSFGLAASSIGNTPFGKLMALAWTSLGEWLDIDIDGDQLCCNRVNGLRVQKQENARTFLRDSTINWGRCHWGTTLESHIKQIRRGWLRQLWPNILVHVCRETDLSVKLSRTPLYCGLCIDFWAPQLMISASRVLATAPRWTIGQENLIALALSTSLCPHRMMGGGQIKEPPQWISFCAIYFPKDHRKNRNTQIQRACVSPFSRDHLSLLYAHCFSIKHHLKPIHHHRFASSIND